MEENGLASNGLRLKKLQMFFVKALARLYPRLISKQRALKQRVRK